MASSLSSLDAVRKTSFVSPSSEGLAVENGDRKAAHVWVRLGTFIGSHAFRNDSRRATMVDMTAADVRSVVNPNVF